MASFRIPTLTEIVKAAKDAIVGLIPDAGVGPGEDYEYEASVMAGMALQLFAPMQYVEDQIFPESAAPENLERHGRLRRLPQKKPTVAEGFLLVTGQNAAVQPQSTAEAGNGVAVVLQAAVTVTTAAWAAKTIIAYDVPRTILILRDVVGMAVGDVLETGGHKYVIRDLPGGGAVIVYGRFDVEPALGAAVTAVPGVRAPIVAALAGDEGNLPYNTRVSFTSPAPNIDPAARVLLLTGGANLESSASWALRMQELDAERNGGGNRSLWLTWTLEVLGVDDAFVYDLFRGLGTADVVPRGVRGARHLSVAKLQELQDRNAPVTPTDANPGKATAGGMDVKYTDFTERQVVLELLLTGGPGYGPTWLGSLTTGVGCTQTRINTAGNPLGVVARGNLVAFPIGVKLIEVGEVQAVDAAGFDLVSPLTESPAVGLQLLPAGALTEPVRDVILNMFEDLGPGDTVPPTRYPAPTTRAPSELTLNLIHATVRDVAGVRNAKIINPTDDINPAPKQQCVPSAIILRYVTGP